MSDWDIGTQLRVIETSHCCDSSAGHIKQWAADLHICIRACKIKKLVHKLGVYWFVLGVVISL